MMKIQLIFKVGGGGEVGWGFEKCFEVLNCYRYAGWGAETGFVEELPF